MKNRHLTAFGAALCLMAALGSGMEAQNYTTPQVVVTTDKVRHNGKVYYSHVVQERQTLFSISKAYNVTLQEIYDANPTLNLETDGLKKDQILLIPVKDTVPAKKETREETATGTKKQETLEDPGQQAPDKAKDGFFVHRVKWFEDLSSIARKYSVSKEAIMNINGMTSEKVRRKDVIKIPLHPEHWEGKGGNGDENPGREAETEETKDVAEQPSGRVFDGLFPRRHKASAAVLLPFNAAGKADSQMMDFYSGVLLAAKDLGDKGNKIELTVYDVAGGSMPVTENKFEENDFTIGPVSNADIIRAVNVDRGKTWIVSPLDPRAEALADTIPNIIQAPAPTKAQILDMANWIRGDLRNEDKVIVVKQKGATASGYSANVIKEMESHGLNPAEISFNILEGRHVMDRISSLMTGNGANRVVIASDNKAFVIEVVRLLYLISSQKVDIVLYSTSRLRTFEEIDVEQLHSLNLHASVSYYVDYDSTEVQEFLMRYKAIYNTEPSRTAFQGYDVMKFFTTLATEYGKAWGSSDNLSGKGLQSDFRLMKTSRGGYVNEAVRRIIYRPDYSINLIR